MWFIFPQLAGLGHSPMAQHYAIRDLDQAKRYLADPILGCRLRQDVQLVVGHKDKSALEILGSPDDLKFRSCLTLFAQAASITPTECCSNRPCTNSTMAPILRTLQLLTLYATILMRVICFVSDCRS